MASLDDDLLDLIAPEDVETPNGRRKRDLPGRRSAAGKQKRRKRYHQRSF